MDPELVKLVHQAAQDGLTSASWIVMVVGIIGAAAGAWLGSYLKSKGEHLATKEDFDELMRQLSAQTKATEKIKAEVAEKLADSTERLKTELSVWAGFRNDVLKDMWAVHRAVAAAMTGVILRAQQASSTGKLKGLGTEITSYRQCVHRSIDLLSPQSVDVAQRFLEAAYEISQGRRPVDDANKLKEIRRYFYEGMAVRFHLGEVMPWTVEKKSAKKSAKRQTG